MGIFLSPCPFLYEDHHREMVIPFGKYSHMGIFNSIPKLKQTPYGNGLVTEQSPFGNGCPFLYGDPHIETESRVMRLPIWKWGLPVSIWGSAYPHFHMVITIWKRGPVSLCSPYGNGDTHMETGIYKGTF